MWPRQRPLITNIRDYQSRNLKLNACVTKVAYKRTNCGHLSLQRPTKNMRFFRDDCTIMTVARNASLF
jgi:hypothetical protein